MDANKRSNLRKEVSDKLHQHDMAETECRHKINLLSNAFYKISTLNSEDESEGFSGRI